ncbi:urease accessory protein [Hymenobacter aquaticus]|uniref:Urease accessory protein n=1 Tax=Hymenobacter aquaticus TaxID=1867101 RepID=A0A4Z0PXZ6_9BACT|nr:urease accessory protein [Hymenobacter aquaticus]TGE22116.1 urease accessory protein [Hymenobacter aquaticus]
MEAFLPILFASVAGLGHAFEPDHLLAVGNMVSRRDSTVLALRDGIFWGLGHTTMLVLVGSVVILSRATFLTSGYFEAAVGVVLVAMGVSRLLNWNKPPDIRPARYQHRLAYTVGLLHGLAGSGALVLLVLSEIRRPLPSILYILVFGLGSILGMFVVAGLCRIPFTRRMKISRRLKFSSILLSSGLCVGYGVWMVAQNV